MSGVNIRIGATNATGGAFRAVNASLTTMNAKLSSFGAGFAKMGAVATAAGAAIAAPLAAAVASFGSAGDQLDKMSKRTGVSVEGLSELAFAAEQSGASIEGVEKGIKGMQRSLYDAANGSEEVTRALDGIGVSVEQLAGKSPEDQFSLLAGKIGEVSDPSLKAALAMKIFGKAGADLVPLMNEGVSGIEKLRQEAGELGRSMSTEDAAAAAEYTDAMNRMKSVLAGLKNQIGAALAPAVTKFVNSIVQGTKGITSFVQENKHLVVALGAAGIGLTVFGGVLVSVGTVIAGASVAIGAIVATVTAVSSAITLALSPVGLVVIGVTAAIAGLTAAIVAIGIKTGLFTDAFEHAKVILANFWETAKETFAGISDALKANDWALAAKISWAGLKVAFFEGLGDITMAFAQMVPKMWNIIQGLFIKMVDNAWKSTKLVAEILADPFGSFEDKLIGFMSNISFDPSKGISGFIKEHTAAARTELDALKAQASQAAKDIEIAKQSEKDKSTSQSINSNTQIEIDASGVEALIKAGESISGNVNQAASKLGSGITSAFQKSNSGTQQTIAGVASTIGGAFSKATNLITGSNIGDAIASQVTSAANTAKQVIGGAAKSVAGKVDAVLGQGDGKLTESVISAISKIGTEAYTSVGDVNSALKNLGFQAPETWNLKTDKSLKLESPTLTANISRLATRGQNQSIQEKTAQNTADTKVAVKAVEAGVTKAVGILDAIFKKPSTGLSLTKVGA